MKWASFVSRQTITKMAVYGGFLDDTERAEGGSSVIWSQEMEDHGPWGIGRGFTKR